jgi:hypothetical protein
MASHPSPPSVHAAIGKTEYFSCHAKILKAEFAAARSSMFTFLEKDIIRRRPILTCTTEADQLDSTFKILEASAMRLDSLNIPTILIDQAQLDGIFTEYYMLRVRLVWTKLFRWKVCS